MTNVATKSLPSFLLWYRPTVIKMVVDIYLVVKNNLEKRDHESKGFINSHVLKNVEKGFAINKQ